jgi:hypothetical protein
LGSISVFDHPFWIYLRYMGLNPPRNSAPLSNGGVSTNKGLPQNCSVDTSAQRLAYLPTPRLAKETYLSMETPREDPYRLAALFGSLDLKDGNDLPLRNIS